MREGQFISRCTAAQLLGLPTLGTSEQLQVGAVRPEKPPHRRELRGHQIKPWVLRAEVTGPLWLPQPADVWGLHAGMNRIELGKGVAELVMAGDCLISGRSRQDRAWCELAELEETVSRFHNTVGVAALRAALPLLRTGVESPAESLLRLIIIDAGFDEPQTCCPIPIAGRTLHSDLGYPELKIAIEFDGKYHVEGGESQARFDNERVEAMIDAGWRVLRATSHDLRAPRPFLRLLANAIENAEAARSGRPTRPVALPGHVQIREGSSAHEGS